ncbi:hypothetical protein ACFLRY_02945 [Bacteroidota bacterium]
MSENKIARDWVKYGTICGLSSASVYIFLNILTFIPGIDIPEIVIRLGLFSVGILGVVSIGGSYHLIKKHKNSVLLQMAVLLSLLAFAFLTLMVVLQQANIKFWQHAHLVSGSKDEINTIYSAIDTIQLGVDLTFDVFYTLAFIFYSILMFKHPRFGKIFSISGFVLFSSFLILNMIAFPFPPGSIGLIDIGPLTGIWGIIVSIQSLRSLKWMEEGNPVTHGASN